MPQITKWLSWTDLYFDMLSGTRACPGSGFRTIIAMGITLYYNADCADCTRKATRTAKLDWLGRVNVSTDTSPIGEVPKGEIVVVDDVTQRVYTGIYATRAICLRVPAYFLYGLALYVSPIRRLFAKDDPGCDGDACEI